MIINSCFRVFIRSKLNEDTPVGDLARDIKGDREFPRDGTEQEQIRYLVWEARETSDIFSEFMREYKIYRKNHINDK